MATTKLILRSDRIGFEKTTIYIQYTHKSIKKKFSTYFSIEPGLWNAKAGKMIGSTDEVVDFNASLQEAKSRIDKIVREAILAGQEPTIDLVTQRVKALATTLPVTPVATPRNFLTTFQQYIDATVATKAHGTIKHYRSTLNHLTAYALDRRMRLAFEHLTVAFYHDFVTYLTQELKMTNGTVNNQLKRVKVVMAYSVDQGYTDNVAFQKFKLLKHTESDIVCLTQEELQLLFEADLEDRPKLARVRDLFILACTTGLRHSDFSTIRPENINGDQLLLRTVKTRDWLRIDLNQYSRAILKRYPDGLPKISQQKFNEFVKELGQYCGIDKPTLVVHYQGSKRIEQYVPKYTLFSSHMGRRTFATQGAERGMPLEVLQKYTGHKDIKTLMRYVRVADEQRKIQMDKAWG